ncbi:hypothetical protein ACFT5B_05300 [Luteimicrobium sp. NPDC057192]|uniref:hypothetical protein n=1 Tax=Luteimicrobium sp. NPDC057192 TaxID=3346042 RepID=UPI003635E126
MKPPSPRPSRRPLAAARALTTVETDVETVRYGGHTWSATWWTPNNQPHAADASPWADEGAC